MANFNFNKVILGGRLTDTPIIKQTTTNKSILRGEIAVNNKGGAKNGKDGVDFIKFVAWEKNAEFISRFFDKGSAICIVGEIRNGAYTDKNGVSRSTTEVNVNEVFFVDSKSERVNVTVENRENGYGYNPYADAPAKELGESPKETPKVEEISAPSYTITDDESDELPF